MIWRLLDFFTDIPSYMLRDEDLAREMLVPPSEFNRRRYQEARRMTGGCPHPLAAEPAVESVRLRYWYLMGKEGVRP